VKRFEFVGDPSDADLVLELEPTAPVGPTRLLETNKINGTSDPVPMFGLWALTLSVEVALLQKTHDRNFCDAPCSSSLNPSLARSKPPIRMPVQQTPIESGLNYRSRRSVPWNFRVSRSYFRGHFQAAKTAPREAKWRRATGHFEQDKGASAEEAPSFCFPPISAWAFEPRLGKAGVTRRSAGVLRTHWLQEKSSEN
jgi:hypothetical protein